MCRFYCIHFNKQPASTGLSLICAQPKPVANLSSLHFSFNDVVEARCYVVDIGRTDREQIRCRIKNNWCRIFWPRPASVVIDSATYLLTVSSPDNSALVCTAIASRKGGYHRNRQSQCTCRCGRSLHGQHVTATALAGMLALRNTYVIEARESCVRARQRWTHTTRETPVCVLKTKHRSIDVRNELHVNTWTLIYSATEGDPKIDQRWRTNQLRRFSWRSAVWCCYAKAKVIVNWYFLCRFKGLRTVTAPIVFN